MLNTKLKESKIEHSLAENMIEFFWKIVWYVALTTFLLMFIIMFFQIFARYILKLSFPWTGEIARILCIWSTFIGIAIAKRSNSHISVLVLLDILSPEKRKVMRLIADAISLILSIIILIGTFIMIDSTRGVLTSTMNMSYSYLYLSLGFGVLIMSIIISKNIFISLDKILKAKKSYK